MSKLFENEIKNMQRLINFGNVNESKDNNANKGVVEYHAVGADGKTYGIIKECSKYYIKVAPKKDTEVLVEDYDYIGGFNNKKENEFLTYSNAAKQFDFKMQSLNEAYSKHDTVERFPATKPAEWQINETKEMRDEINRYNQIVNNVSNILNENKGGDQFTDSAKYEGDKDKKTEKKDPKSAGYPFDKKNGKSDNGEDPYKEKPGKTEDMEEFGLAGATGKPTGKKPVKFEKNRKRNVKLTEEQVLAWSKSKDFMDKTRGTHIGSSYPYRDEADDGGLNASAHTEPLREHDIAVHNTDSQNSPTPGNGPKGKSYPYTNKKQKIYEVDVDVDDEYYHGDDEDSDYAGHEPTADELEDIDTSFLDDYDDDGYYPYESRRRSGRPMNESYDDIDDDKDVTNGEINSPDEEWFGEDEEDTDDFDCEPTADDLKCINTDLPIYNSIYDVDDEDNFPYDDDYFPYESRRRSGRPVNEMVLNDFGKHPAYQKKVMTLPPNVEIDKFGRDWNDKSAKGDRPYGTKIGSSYPYTEKLVDKITDIVMNEMYSKKKI